MERTTSTRNSAGALRCAMAMLGLPACVGDGGGDGGSPDTTAGSDGGDDAGGGTTMCVDDPGAFGALVDWSNPPGLETTPFIAVHAVHMPPAPAATPGQPRDPATERLFLMGGYFDQHLWDPATGMFEYYPLPEMENSDLFCAGHALTPLGNILIVGGGGGSAMDAINRAYWFSRGASGAGGWLRLADMTYERWYPSLTMLPDGRVFVFGGEGGGADIPEIYDPTTDSWTVLEATDTWSPSLYPLMFLLPDGNLFYAGGEQDPERPEGEPNAGLHVGRVLDMSANPPTWLDAEFPGQIPGGSAVMFAPGIIMRSGGSTNPDATTEWIDMRGDYTNGRSWDSLPEHVGDMSTPRHFHTLTMLPDGKVAATGGNWYGQWATGDDSSQPCEVGMPPQPINEMLCDSDGDCPVIAKSCVTGAECGPGTPGPTCDATGCAMGLCKPKTCTYSGEACADDTDCPDAGYCMSNPAFDHDDNPDTPKERVCWPGHNECFGTRTAEIWDPATKLWSPCPASPHATEDVSRMYHGNALLLRDATVISMGGGKSGPLDDQTSAQIFTPPYGGGVAPEISLSQQTVPYGGSVVVELGNAAATSIERVTLIHLGSATHGFNMDQRFIDLTDTMMPIGNDVQVTVPDTATIATPGWYFVFALDPTGTPSVGQHLEITDDTVVSWICGPGPGLTVREYGCLPSAGPTCGTNSTYVTLPLPSLGGGQSGWRVHSPPGMVADPQSPTSAELAAVKGLCSSACALEWQNEPGVVATCTSPTAFATPVAEATLSSPSTLAAIPTSFEYGADVFPPPAPPLTCNLESGCCTAFDEAVCAATPERPTPSATPLGRGQAYLVPWSTTKSSLEIITNTGTWTRSLSGTAGHSPCRDGNASAPCSYYLGSLSAATTSPVSASVQCSDSTTLQATISSMQFTLAQPAFGIEKAASTERGFPPGALIIETTVTINGQTYIRRQPNSVVVKGTQSSPTLIALNMDVPITFPCNSGTGTAIARLDLSSTGAQGSPPTGTITVPSQVTCGVSRALTKTTSDPDNDIASTKWLVDGTLLAPSVTSVVFTGTHTLGLRVRDARGATTTATKVISCANP